MSLFGRIKNIIRSNINSKTDSSLFSGFENFNTGVETESSGYQNDEKNNYRSEEQRNETQTLEQEYYANLELPYGAGFDEIKASYKRLLKKYHPDRFYGDEKKLAIAQNVVKKLNKAYDYFCNKYN